MNENRLLSIIIPTYNSELYLKECLASISSLDIASYEIIIIDDGSQDETWSIIDAFNPDEKVFCKKLRQRHLGASVARNAGLARAEGEYILFLDSDDYVNPDMLVKCLLSAKKNKSDFVTTPYFIFDENKKWTAKRNLQENNIFSGRQFFSHCVMQGSLRTELCINLFKKKILMDHSLNFYPGIYYEDSLFLVKFMYFSQKACYFNIPFYYYRQHSDSVTANRVSESKKHSEGKVIELVFEFFENYQIHDKWWNEFLVSRYYRMVRFRNVSDNSLASKILWLHPLPASGWVKKAMSLALSVKADKLPVVKRPSQARAVF